ncbi:Gfo/Idh/MocA family oxidoreductase [Aquibium sp. A9E412]|uniref:Gfo/Idh/MocA family protein n=1 Tax=Aquibium sp. A9E412 TaxID=2976767 RepID=UPI0025AF1BF2|nr:Gfo/Idh/MocA family oxidoreductase [Aquibium sp. A9E412]MDN2566781.1 Gfo/Idh/MocA family oxidoreductase [Aquibium sp. A9E412]
MLSEPQPRASTFPSSSCEGDAVPVRYGIVGSGMMGQEHIRNIQLLPGASVAAVADPDAGMRAMAAALAGPGCAAFADHRALLAAGGCDALVVASPNHTHAPILAELLAGDLPVLVEKPLCATVADCRRVLRLAEGRRAPVWVAMEYRYMLPLQRLIDEIGAGTAGRPRMIAIREHRFPFLKKVGDWNRFTRNTGGTLVEKCCHFFDLMRLLVGAEAVRVYASGGRDVNFLDERYPDGTPDMLDNAFVVVDFANGVRAMLDLCMFAEGAHWQETVSVTGDAARVEAFIPGPARFAADGRERPSEIVVSPRTTKRPVREELHTDQSILQAGDHHGSTYFQHVKFNALVRQGGRPEVTLEDGLKAVLIGAAAEESARTGQPVTLA